MDEADPIVYSDATGEWDQPDPIDITFPVRRALLLRSFLKAKNEIDRDLLNALVRQPRYCHGARSMEKGVESLRIPHAPLRLAQLPPPQVLSRHLDTCEAFQALVAMMYAYMQLGRDGEAKALAAEVLATRKLNVDHFAGAYAHAAIPARYTLERGRWADAAALTLTPSDLGWEKFPQAESITWFARGIGAARGGNVADAKQSLARLTTLRDTLGAAKNTYWAEQAEIQRLAVSA
jgi:hypothetical protein